MAKTNEELIEKSDWIILAVKPYQAEEVLKPLKAKLLNKKIINIMAGWNYERLNEFLGTGFHHISTMPNVPVEVNKGIILCEAEHSLTEEELEEMLNFLEKIASVSFPEKEEFQAASVLSGCGPAFVAMIIEGFSDALVKHGVKRERAYEISAETLEGTSRLYLDTKKHLGQIKDEVCSPGGTTIKGVVALEEFGLRNALINAIDAISN